jgi:hypothetical protein
VGLQEFVRRRVMDAIGRSRERRALRFAGDIEVERDRVALLRFDRSRRVRAGDVVRPWQQAVKRKSRFGIRRVVVIRAEEFADSIGH